MDTFMGIALQVIVASVLALTGLFLMRRSVRITTLESHHEVGGIIYCTVGTIYAVLIAFVVVVVYDQYRESNLRVGQEAAMLVRVKRNCEAFPDSIHRRTERLMVSYSRSMIDDEFPAMAQGRLSPRTEQIYDSLWALYYHYRPADDDERLWYAEVIDKLNELGEARRMRIQSLDFGVPAAMWAILYCGAVLTIGYCYLFGTKRALPHAVMVVILTLSILLVLILIEALDHPYWGLIRVSDASFREIVGILQCP